jgi:hypothetical protein
MTMANGRELFDKIFHKRSGSFSYHSAGRRRSRTPVLDIEVNRSIPHFPVPSFIKPTGTRMMAREEVVGPIKSNRRTQSLPENETNASSPAPTSNHTHQISAGSLIERPTVPSRSSSLRLRRRREISIASLLNFQFPSTAIQSSSLTLTPPLSPNETKGEAQSVRESPSKAVMASRPDTPPPSDPEDDTLSTLSSKGKFLSPAPEMESSTQSLQAASSPAAENSSVREQFDSPVPRLIKRISYDSFSATSPPSLQLRKVVSDSVLASSAQDKVLHEPTFGDFLSLSDDDIGDGPPPSRDGLTRTVTAIRTQTRPTPGAAKPAEPFPPQSSSKTANLPRNPKHHRLLTLSPPLATRPATAAAFEAAAIAAKYHFDLVYVVNLWPHQIISRAVSKSELPATPSSSSSTSPRESVDQVKASVPKTDLEGSLACMNPRSGMTGRLLAAYGLNSIASPFRISAPVHKKILRSKGWIEYRNPDAAANEFTRGYGCSFYTSTSSVRKTNRLQDTSTETSSDTSKAASTTKNAPTVNRGIVFAAYRLPETEAAQKSRKINLGALHQDAESLVEMLIDIHTAQRSWKAAAASVSQMEQAGLDRQSSRNQ